ncbi:hypothetical protein MHU86_14943 [Fragilaria crotonensis]|nr:hypothetical protein MHU86_14943 [Fragilaria crotonensis]
MGKNQSHPFLNAWQLTIAILLPAGFCAAYSHGITTPIDVIKTKMQADPTEYNDGMLSAAAKIIKKDGPGFCSAVSVIEDQPTAFILASIAAGAVAALILCPAESVRIRIVTDKDYADKGLLSGLPKLIKDEGFLEMFGGFPAMLTKQVPYTMAKQVSFDFFAAMLYTLLKGTDIDMKWVVSVAAAASASVLACTFSQPGDMILTETYKGGTQDPSVRSSTQSGAWWNSGVLCRNTGQICARRGIITTQLVVYDIVKQLLGLPATGSH